jgi:hypothetical protein
MPEFMDAERFTRLVAKRLADDGIPVEKESDGWTVNGDLEEILFVVLDEYGQHGPVMFGD